MLWCGDARVPTGAGTGDASGCLVPSSTTCRPFPVTQLPPVGTGTVGRGQCPVPHPVLPCACRDARLALHTHCVPSPGAVSSVAAGEPGEGPCHRLPCGAGIHQRRGSGSIYNQEVLACQRATFGCTGHGQSVPWATSAATGGVPLPFLGCCCSTLWGPSPGTVGPMLWGTPMPQGFPWQCQPQGSGGRAAVLAARGGSIISAVTHVLITENGLISLRLEAA